jgi:hypothetical protein
MHILVYDEPATSKSAIDVLEDPTCSQDQPRRATIRCEADLAESAVSKTTSFTIFRTLILPFGDEARARCSHNPR